MKICINATWGKFHGSVSELIEKELNGTDYGRGELEEIKASIENIREFLGKIIDALADNGHLRAKQITDALNTPPGKFI